MSTLVLNKAQLGQSLVATRNFTLDASAADGTMKLARGNAGATTQDVITVDSSGNVDHPVGAKSMGVPTEKIQLGTTVNTTSGTSVDFTGIPSWVKKITILLNGVSPSGTSGLIIQIGAGSLDTSGYLGAESTIYTAVSTTNMSSGFMVANGSTGTDVRYGMVTLVLMGNNTWVMTGICGQANAYTLVSGGAKALTGVLDRLRLTHINGTDTFDAGSVNILMEG